MKPSPELIIVAGVEGGGVTLYGERRPDGGWRYRTFYADQTPLMLGEEAIERKGGWVNTWEEALAQLDAQRWFRLPGVKVHLEFRAATWAAIQQRLGDPASQIHRREALLSRWKERCGMSETTP